MTAPERPAPQEPTAQEHADTLRNDLRRAKERLFPGTWEKYRCRVSVDGKALDALLADVERLTAERDEAMASNAVFMSDEAYSRLHDAWHVEQERAEAAEAEVAALEAKVESETARAEARLERAVTAEAEVAALREAIAALLVSLTYWPPNDYWLKRRNKAINEARSLVTDAHMERAEREWVDGCERWAARPKEAR